jgi:hypothetical protein
MLKMGLHEPFGHLSHKLWQKERSGVKLAFWLPTTKSQESTWPLHVQMECDISLERSRQELQVFFILHPNRRSEQKVMISQSCGSLNRTISGLLFGSPGTKSHSDVGATERHREYYMGEGGGFPESGPWWVLWVQSPLWLILAVKVL